MRILRLTNKVAYKVQHDIIPGWCVGTGWGAGSGAMSPDLKLSHVRQQWSIMYFSSHSPSLAQCTQDSKLFLSSTHAEKHA